LTIQLDELWSFVGSKDNKQWVWLAKDADSREIVGVKVGVSSRQSAKQLWQSLRAVDRRAVCYTDFCQAYEQVLPSKRPKSRWLINGENQLC
jgi:IS1 family transposase